VERRLERTGCTQHQRQTNGGLERLPILAEKIRLLQSPHHGSAVARVNLHKVDQQVCGQARGSSHANIGMVLHSS